MKCSHQKLVEKAGLTFETPCVVCRNEKNCKACCPQGHPEEKQSVYVKIWVTPKERYALNLIARKSQTTQAQALRNLIMREYSTITGRELNLPNEELLLAFIRNNNMARLKDISYNFGWSSHAARKLILSLKKKGLIESRIHERQQFYTLTQKEAKKV